MKYSKEFKLECVQRYKNGDHIEDPPGMKHKVFYNQLLQWTKIYDSLGETGLEHNKPTLNINQRIELINRVEAGESYTSVALSAGAQLSIAKSTISYNLFPQIDGYISRIALLAFLMTHQRLYN